MHLSSLISRAALLLAGDAFKDSAQYGLTPAAILSGLTPGMGFVKWLQELSNGLPCPVSPEEKPLELDTPLGRIRGVSQEGIRIFRGIRYALPTDGPRRFAPPIPAGPWEGVYDATRFGPPVVQPGASDTEDGLFLNIWAPDRSQGSLPVFVFVHGGSYLFGSGALRLYDGTSLARRGILVVTLNYRLNTPGFLPMKTTLDRYGTTGNWGLLDVLCALEWVKENIGAFGGDPDRVTLGGQSAGSFSVSALISAPKAKGLFRQAILQSGGIGSMPMVAPQTGGELRRCLHTADSALRRAGLEDTPEGLESLRAMSPEEVLSLRPEVQNVLPPQATGFWPVFDGGFLPRRPRESLRHGAFNRVRLLFGSTTDEVSFFIPPTLAPAEYETLVKTAFGRHAAEVLARYPAPFFFGVHRLCRNLANASGLRAGMFPYADALAAAGEPVYAYRFDALDPFLRKTAIGAPHAAELKFLFQAPGAMTDDEAAADAEDLQSAWAAFIRTGDPNRGSRLPTRWEPYTPENRRELKLGRGTCMEPVYQRELIDFANRLFDEIEQDEAE